MTTPVQCLSTQVKDDLAKWFDRRINELTNLKNMHKSLLGLDNDGYEVWQMAMGDTVMNYKELKLEFTEFMQDCD